MITAIDMWAPIVPSPEIIDHVAVNFPVAQLQYLEVFTKQTITEDQFRAYAHGLTRDHQQIRDDLEAAGISQSLITGFDEATTCGKTFVSNQAVAATAAADPERYIPFAGADIMRGSYALDELTHWITQAGFRGLSLRPFMIGQPATHPAYFPFYAKCVELGVPLSIHTSANWTRSSPSELGHPRYIDEVACHFPELTILMSHAGYPWVLEACLVAWKHPNVYLELGAHRPKYFAAAGAGWEPLMRFGQRTIKDKIVWGSGAFLINRPYEQLANEMRELPVAPDVLTAWMSGNAERLLDGHAPSAPRLKAV